MVIKKLNFILNSKQSCNQQPIDNRTIKRFVKYSNLE